MKSKKLRRFLISSVSTAAAFVAAWIGPAPALHAQTAPRVPSASSTILPTLEQRSDEPLFWEPAARAEAVSKRNRERSVRERYAKESELEKIAVIDRKVWIPMRDGKEIAADIYRPKDAKGRVPIVLIRTPYNFDYWDVQLGAAVRAQRRIPSSPLPRTIAKWRVPLRPARGQARRIPEVAAQY